MNAFSFLLRPLLWYWSRRARSRIEGNLVIPGLMDKVRVRWDPHAVPHVFAACRDDLFFTQGYLHARERLWQMDFNRRFHSGRLAEILGNWALPWQEVSVRLKNKTTVDLDHFVRLMGIRRTAAASLDSLPQEVLQVLEAYSNGVNRYIETHMNALPVEFRLLRYQPDSWQPVDCLTVCKGFALLLSTALFTRLTMDAVAEKLKDQPDKVEALVPGYPEGGATVTRCRSEKTADQSRKLLAFFNGTFYASQWNPAGHGSNAWALSPSRSINGKPLLCNDPHLRLTLPSPWYLNCLQAPSRGEAGGGYAVWGASIPGSPCIHLGRSRRVAWGVTAALCDDVDLYREKIHPHDPGRYRVGDRWEPIQTTEETIRVRGRQAVRRELRLTRHGPVITDFIEPSSTGEVLSLRWTALDPSDDFRAVYGINRARNWSEFIASLSYQSAPTLNYIYADREGNIGYSLAGRVPRRRQPPCLAPLPGWREEFDWDGYVSFDELPRLYNPREGIVATANNGIADPGYPYYLSVLFEPPYRIERIKELLTAKDRFSSDDMCNVQKDVVSLQATRLIQVLRDDLNALVREGSNLGSLAGKLMRWDGRCDSKSSEAAVYHVFYHRLMVNLLGPELGDELLTAYLELFNQAIVPTDRILADAGSSWFRSRSRRSLVEQSLDEAWHELKARLGDREQTWEWGKLHTMTLDHPLGRIGILAPYFSLGPYPAPGNSTTVNSGFYRHASPFQHVVGTSLRMVLTPGDWERSRIVLPSGQSGNPLSPHYRDQFQLWSGRGSIPLSPDTEQRKDWPLLTLSPTTQP